MGHGDVKADHRVVVGIDGSPVATAALGWAARHAALTGAVVEAVTAWEPAAGTNRAMPPDVDGPDAASRLLADAISRLGGSAPVRSRVLKGHPARVLIDASAFAELQVIGDRSENGGFLGAPLGTVSQRCVLYAQCPVVVIRGPRSSPPHGGSPDPGQRC